MIIIKDVAWLERLIVGVFNYMELSLTKRKKMLIKYKITL